MLCLQFSPTDSEKVMISSADPNVRIFDKVDGIHKLRGENFDLTFLFSKVLVELMNLFLAVIV